MLWLVMLLGFGVLKVTVQTKVLNFGFNIGSVAVFAISGATWWWVRGAIAWTPMAGGSLSAARKDMC